MILLIQKMKRSKEYKILNVKNIKNNKFKHKYILKFFYIFKTNNLAQLLHNPQDATFYFQSHSKNFP